MAINFNDPLVLAKLNALTASCESRPSRVQMVKVPHSEWKTYLFSGPAYHFEKGNQTISGEKHASCEQIAFSEFEREMRDQGWSLGRPFKSTIITD